MPSRLRPSRLLRPLMTDFFKGLLFHIPICYKLGLKLFKSLSRGTWMWIIMLVRLIIFTVVLLPGWIGMVKYWLFSPNIVRNVEYGLGAKKRNLLDVYLPAESHGIGTPVIVFVTGGAWIIGYKLWCALIGRGLSSMGILTIVPDYRNFPQGDVEDMVTDVIAAVSWTTKNAESYGGDPEKIVLAGQSAGAHICMCALMDALRARIENQKNLKRYPVLSKPDDVKVEQNSRNETSIMENLMLPVRSLNGRNSFFDGISPILGRTAFIKRKEDDKIVEKILDNSGTNNVFEGSDEGPDTENDDDDDNEGDEDEDGDAMTWKSSSRTPIKNNMKVEKPMTIDTSTPPKENYEMSHSEKLSQSNLFTKLESPHRVREIPVLVGSVFRNTGSDIKNGFEGVYKEIMEKVEGVSADLKAEGEDLKNLSQRPVTHDPLDLTVIKLFIGISGPYNLLALSSHMQSRGLDHSILKWICRGDVKKYSPVLHLDSIMSRCLSTASSPTSSESEKKLRGKSSSSKKDNSSNVSTNFFFDNHQATDVIDIKSSQKIILDPSATNSVEDFNSVKNTDLRLESVSSSSKYSATCDNEKSVENGNENEIENGLERFSLNGLCFPPVALFHGAEDISVPSSVSVEMAAAICRWGGEVFLRMYEGWAHTDPILEGPLVGDNTLCTDIVTQIKKIFPPSPSPPPPSSAPNSTSVSTSVSAAVTSNESAASISATSGQPSSFSATSTASSGIQSGLTASSLISSAFPAFSSLRPRTHLIPKALTISRSDSQVNSEEGSSIRNTSSVSTDDLFSTTLHDNKVNRKSVEKNQKNIRKNSSEKSTLNGARTMNSPVSVSTVCPRCSLRFRLAATKSVIDRIQNCHDVDDNIESEEREDSDESDVIFRNSGGEYGKEVLYSEYFPSKSGISYVSAVPVVASADKMCCGGRLVRKHRGENHCKCVISEVSDGEKKGSSAVPVDDFKDCRVPRFFVGIARWVNPF